MARSRSREISDRQFNRFVLLAMGLGFVALVVAGVAAALVSARNQAHARMVAHTYEVERTVFVYRTLFERAETARRGVLLTGRADFIGTHARAAAAIPNALARLQRLTADNPRQQATLAAIRSVAARQIELTTRSIAAVQAGRTAEAVAMFRTDASIPTLRRLRALTDRMFAEENRLLALREVALRRTARVFFWVVATAGLLLVAVGLLSLVVIRRYTGDLARTQADMRRLNEGLEDAVRTRTADLQRANDEIQRFAYIVSHDLRSPLVNVMGFTAELATAAKPLATLIERAEAEAPQIVTSEARDAARVDLPEAIGFIRASTQKMDRLINAILKLSREGRRVIAPEPIDLDALVEGIAKSLAHRLDATGTTLTAHALPPLVSDRLAIEQVLSNLIENAVKYAQPGRAARIDVRGHRRDGRVILEVADNGRGIDRRDHERVFDLFRRSGVQDQPGEGIGLAHVRALIYRLGGTIGCDSALGQGATFRVSLPERIGEKEDRA